MDVDFETETLEESLLPSVAIIDLPGCPPAFFSLPKNSTEIYLFRDVRKYCFSLV